MTGASSTLMYDKITSMARVQTGWKDMVGDYARTKSVTGWQGTLNNIFKGHGFDAMGKWRAINDFSEGEQHNWICV